MIKSWLARPVLVLTVCLAACTSVSQPTTSALAVEALRELPNQTYALKPEGADLGFSVNPLGFPAIRGTFEDFDGTVTIVDAAADGLDVEAVVNLDSVKFGSTWYENVVRSPAWFDIENHPEAVFSGSLKAWDGDGVGTVVGEATIKGITQPAEFTIQLNCDVKEACPVSEVGFTGEIVVNRTDFDMRAYRGLVGDKVRLQFSGALIAAPIEAAELIDR
ncbi:MAG: YceI family protein [Parvularculaceae bacterium]|nr:YceI family protein [Parvularculaceae bacterium]